MMWSRNFYSPSAGIIATMGRWATYLMHATMGCESDVTALVCKLPMCICIPVCKLPMCICIPVCVQYPVQWSWLLCRQSHKPTYDCNINHVMTFCVCVRVPEWFYHLLASRWTYLYSGFFSMWILFMDSFCYEPVSFTSHGVINHGKYMTWSR